LDTSSFEIVRRIAASFFGMVKSLQGIVGQDAVLDKELLRKPIQEVPEPST
jgi:hypothetical protein